MFSEYDTLFSSVFGKSSKAFLKITYGTPDQIVEINTKSLAILLRKVSRGRYNTDKAREIKSLAARSVGLTLCSNAFAFQIRILIEQIKFTEKQIDETDRKLKRLNSVILIILGAGPVIGAVILEKS